MIVIRTCFSQKLVKVPNYEKKNIHSGELQYISVKIFRSEYNLSKWRYLPGHVFRKKVTFNTVKLHSMPYELKYCVGINSTRLDKSVCTLMQPMAKKENVKNELTCHVTRQIQYNPDGGGATVSILSQLSDFVTCSKF